jgi:predicted site-specific integrase-resolvase
MIVIEEPKVNKKLFYTVAETSAVLNIDRSTLYRWENAGEITGTINRNGRRLYNGLAIIKLWRLKRTGMTL